MRDVLARSHRPVLQQFAWSSVLLAFDYDGTLAPIVADPGRAAMRPATRRLLAEVAQRYPTVVISGRARPDAERWLRGIPLREIVGNHGIEPWQATAPFSAEVRLWEPVLAARLAGLRGVRIENKTFSLAVHYRQSREKRKARAAILEAAAALGPARVIGGKQVFNLLPEGAPHKGMALERERDRLRLDTAVYVGDDETDEDVFGLFRPGRLLAVRVGYKKSSLASYYLRTQRAVDGFLAALLDLRPAPALAMSARP
jgi:trehalose 6-phosphate phosphatase